LPSVGVANGLKLMLMVPKLVIVAAPVITSSRRRPVDVHVKDSVGFERDAGDSQRANTPDRPGLMVPA